MLLKQWRNLNWSMHVFEIVQFCFHHKHLLQRFQPRFVNLQKNAKSLWLKSNLIAQVDGATDQWFLYYNQIKYETWYILNITNTIWLEINKVLKYVFNSRTFLSFVAWKFMSKMICFVTIFWLNDKQKVIGHRNWFYSWLSS